MEFKLDISPKPYLIHKPQDIPTPRLLVFEDRIDHNIAKMAEMIKILGPEFNLSRLCPHVKTHKSIWTTKKLLHAGVTIFKATLNEVEMLIAAGVKKIFIAYPLLPHSAQLLAQKIKAHPGIEFYIQIGHEKHITPMLEIAHKHKIVWRFFIDLDVGMHRTGCRPESAKTLYHAFPMVFEGIHAYDGHLHQDDHEERRKQAAISIETLEEVLDNFYGTGILVPRVILGGTPGLLADLKVLKTKHLPTDIFLSPGTWIYFDGTAHALMPGTFDIAACILAQVIDCPAPNTATLNLGHKRWAIDQGPIKDFSVPGIKAVSWSEEHTVVTNPGNKLGYGDYVLIAPKHICSTVNLYSHFAVIKEGEIIIDNCPVDGRNQ